MTAILVGILLSGAASGFIAFLVARRLHTQGLLYTTTFHRMSGALGLTRKQARLLTRLAREAKVTAPATLLISRGNFDRATRLARNQSTAEALGRIRQRLFD